MERTYQVGDYVVITDEHDAQAVGKVAIVERHLPEYPNQRWYWLRFLTSIPNAPFSTLYPTNATHGAYMEANLRAAEGDDFAEPPTVGNEVV